MNTFWRAGENVLVHLVPMLMWRMMTPLRMKPTRNTPNSFLEVIQSLYYSVRRKLIFSICACSVHEMWHFIGCCHTLYELMLRLHPLTLGIESSHTSSNLSACSRAYNKISEQHLLAVVVLLLKVMLWDSFFNTDIIHLTKTEKNITIIFTFS